MITQEFDALMDQLLTKDAAAGLVEYHEELGEPPAMEAITILDNHRYHILVRPIVVGSPLAVFTDDEL